MIKDYLRPKISSAIRKSKITEEPIAPEDISLEKPPEESFGDFACNIALTLAKPLKSPPLKIAEAILKQLELDESKIKKVEIAGQGYINFFLSESWLYQALKEILQRDEAYGKTNRGGGKKAQVEFVSANPTGPLSVGHGRQAIIGDSIANLLEWLGYKVTREYYFNDSGNQMKVLAQSVFARYQELLGHHSVFPESGYQGDYIRDIARAVLEKYGEKLNENDLNILKETAEEIIFNEIKKTLERLGIVFDVYFNESSLYSSGKVQEVVKNLKEKGFAYEREEALWFRASAFGLPEDRVILRSSGEPTYRLPDIAYHVDKLERGFELIVDIFGADHQVTYPDVLAGVKALGLDDSKIKVLIHQFVILTSGGQKVKMSTRKATFVTLDQLIEEVGVEVVRFFYLMRRLESHLEFDLELAKKTSEENPVYYVQYAHARVCSILKYAEERGIKRIPLREINLELLKEPEEIALIKLLINFPDLVEASAKKYEPHRIPSYLQEVAGVFHNFYQKHRVVTGNPDLTQARLVLVDATRIVLKNGLKIIGVSAPEKM
ncbi:MAG: arginine--tRNA ligase [Candidatus Edwardsbacteria bacterium]